MDKLRTLTEGAGRPDVNNDSINLGVFCRLLALLILATLSLNLVLCTATFFAGRSISTGQPLVSLLAATVVVLAICKTGRWPGRYLALLFILFVTIFSASVALESQISDTTVDGQTYQGTAMAKLARGWNPVKDPQNIDPVPYTWILDNIVQFPKAHWIDEAAILKVTGNLEAGKAINIIFATSSFLLLLSLFLNLGCSKTISTSLALLISLNPVTLNQLFCYYCDGLVSSLIICFVACCILLVHRYNRLSLALLALVTINLANLKFGALGLLIVMGSVYCIALVVFRKRTQASKIIPVFCLSLGFAVLFVGYNPYITNYKTGGHPFYPYNSFSESNPTRIMQEKYQTPANFRGRGPVHSLLFSIFSHASSNYQPETNTFGPARLKWPFTFTLSELKEFEAVDTRAGGWGPLFGGAFLLSIIAFVLLFRRKQPGAAFRVLLIVLLGVLSSVLALPDHWWARFAPHVALIPLAIVGYIVIFEGRRMKTFAWIIAGILALNSLLIAIPCFHHGVLESRALNRQLSAMAAKSTPTLVCFGPLHFNRIRFEHLGIRYIETAPLAGKGMPLPGAMPEAATTIY